jgi:hypothetical protein
MENLDGSLRFAMSSGRIIQLNPIPDGDPLGRGYIAAPVDREPMDIEEFWEAREAIVDFRATGNLQGMVIWDFTPHQYGAGA